MSDDRPIVLPERNVSITGSKVELGSATCSEESGLCRLKSKITLGLLKLDSGLLVS